MKKVIILAFFISTYIFAEENSLKAGIGGFFRKDIYKFENKPYWKLELSF